MMQAAIAIGFMFDHSLSDDVAPLGSLLDLPLAGSTLSALVQVQMPTFAAKPRNPRHATFNWKKLAPKIAAGEVLSVGIHRTLPVPEATQLGISLRCAPRAAIERERQAEGFRYVPWRYDGTIEIGTSFLGDNTTVDHFFDELLLHWMSQINLVASSVVAAETLNYAGGIARCSGGMPGTELDRRSTALWIASKGWGPKAREPEWGTYLTRAHADAIGGTNAIRTQVDPYRILEAGNVVFVQLTPYDQALLPITNDKRTRLENLLRPILAEPLSREWRLPPAGSGAS
jgi:hypothetical protein